MTTSKVFVRSLCAAASLWALGTAQAGLLGRDIQGQAVDANSATAVFIYDTQFDVTWLRDMNDSGSIFRDEALSFADGLQVGAWGDWSLPTATDIQNLWITTLGNSLSPNLATITVNDVNVGPFVDFDPAKSYWVSNPISGGMLGLQYRPLPSFFMPVPLSEKAYAPAMRAGDVTSTVSPVPEPGTYALMALGLAGLALRRRMQRT